MKTPLDFLLEKEHNQENLCIAGKYTLKTSVIEEAMREYADQFIKQVKVEAKVSDDFCGHCMYLSLTEEEQTDKKEDHFCKLFHKRVLHFDKHPLLPRLDECMSIGKPSKNSR